MAAALVEGFFGRGFTCPIPASRPRILWAHARSYAYRERWHPNISMPAVGPIPGLRLSPLAKREFTFMNTMSMNTTSDLTIVIPAKNEASLIPQLLASLVRQDYSKMSSTKVLVADANSTDGTPEIALAFRKWLEISVIPGGMPSVGRNKGAAVATTDYVLFLDADIELASDSLLRDAIELAQRKQLECVTTKIVCRHGNALDKLLYSTNNFFQQLSRLHRPFSTGMFMLFERRKFQELGDRKSTRLNSSHANISYAVF